MKYQRNNGKGERKSKSMNKSRGGTLLGIFIGLVIGVLVAFGVVWTLNKMPNPFQGKAGKGSEPAAGAGSPATPASKPNSSGGPQALGGKPGDKVPEGGDKPRFEFYKILPGGQEGASGQTPAAGTTPATGTPEKPPVAASEPQLLQVGAFQKQEDADNLKAKLALMGLEASVEVVDIPEKGKMHRVRLGPYTKVEELNRMKALLSQNGIQASIIKVAKAH
jgi:cell division protein FtsN